MATAFLCGCLGCFIKIIGKSVYVKNYIEEDLVNFRAKAVEDMDRLTLALLNYKRYASNEVYRFLFNNPKNSKTNNESYYAETNYHY